MSRFLAMILSLVCSTSTHESSSRGALFRCRTKGRVYRTLPRARETISITDPRIQNGSLVEPSGRARTFHAVIRDSAEGRLRAHADVDCRESRMGASG